MMLTLAGSVYLLVSDQTATLGAVVNGVVALVVLLLLFSRRANAFFGAR